ncbi:MAG: tRNA lysidine(34) synthetase TilS [Desulfovibrionales bacterium]|nr:tRNA lysidine(34) synthetase TilS [Desulfovibrionales bacterium]
MQISLPQKIQQLSPASAHLCLNIEKFITNKLAVSLTNTTLIVAISGGVDSTALLLTLKYLSEKLQFSIVAAHFNHKLRAESDAEQKHVLQLCQALSIPVRTASNDVAGYAKAHKMGIEEAARALRYSFLNDIKKDTNADWIATGHHANDLAEDVIMRLTRGTGWPALAGMEGRCDTRRLLRPLLHIPKKTLTKFVMSLHLDWCEDASNLDENFLRNRVRLHIIPMLCKENPAFLDAITALWDMGQIDKDHWLQTTTKALENTDIEAPVLHKKDLASMTQATRLQVYKAVLAGMGKGQPLYDNLLALDNAWLRNTGGKTIQFPGSKIATISKGSIYFSYR